jgi:hypothetical protein
MALLMPMAYLVLGMTVPLAGTVVDAAGRPVAGATVWLGDTIANRQGPEVLATGATDDHGRFWLERADDLTGRGALWSPTLWAYHPGARVAFLEFKGNLPAAGEPVRLVLGPPASTAIRVLHPDGKPARGARVRLAQATLKAPRPPDTLLDRLAATTDADGRATLDGLAPADIFALDVTAEGQLVQCLPIDPDTATVTLSALGRLKARIVADDPMALRGWTITVQSRPTEAGYRDPYTTHPVRETTGDDGLVEFPALAVGAVLWEIKPPEGSSSLVAKPPRATIRAGETEVVEIPVIRAVRVEGTVLEEPAGVPVPGVTIDLQSLTHFSGRVNFLVTDAQGRFSTLVLPGRARFSFWLHDMPRTHFLPPSSPHWADFDVKEGATRQTFTPPRLQKAVQVRGKVVDESGKPAAGVGVMGSMTSAEYGRNPNAVRAETDTRGEFILGSIAPKSEVVVSVDTSLIADADPVTVASAGEGAPITLRIRKRPTLALSGRVLGTDHRPLAGALVQIKIRAPNQPGNSGGDFAFEGSEDVRTGPDGRYRTPAQLPIGNEYRVEAEAPGYEPARSSWLVAPAGGAPDLRLRRSVGVRAVAGRVVDSAGQPVAGAEVSQSGDGPRRTRGTTGSDGRFQVPGVPNAPAFLFVAKAGFHFLGRRIEPGERSVNFALRRLDEPPAAPLRPAAAPVPRAEERAIARALLAEAQKAPGGAHEVPERWELPEIAALLDPDRVIAMIENQVFTAGPGLLAAVAVGRSEDDPQTALEILDAIDEPSLASATALTLFDRLGTTAPPERRRELLERAARRPPLSEDPGQAASLLARIADRWLDLGDTGRGAAAVRKARALAEKPRERPFPDPRDDLVPALARVDLPAALKLLQGRDPQQRFQLDTLRVGIARRIAAIDSAAARRILGLIDEHGQRRARRVICLRMAAKDLPAARALAAEDHDPIVEALLPAIAARARAVSDPDGARALLREAIERLGKLDDAAQSSPSPAVALARLLPLAARIDAECAPDVFWLALARRPPLPALPEPLPILPQVRQHYLDRAELAVLVARYDRAAAEAVFAPVADRLVGLHEEPWGLGAEGPALFRAAGAYDARLARALLDALPEDPPPPAGPPTGMPDFRHHTKAQGQIALARILALPPALRLRELFLTHGGDDGFPDFGD